MADPLIINQFDQGIADSPHVGFGLMRNVDIEAFPGAIKSQKAAVTIFHTALTQNFTAVAATDLCTLSSGVTPATGTAVNVSSTGTLPGGLAASTSYFVINVSASTFRLATTIANANAATAIDITSAGTGTHTVVTENPATIRHIVRDGRTGNRFLSDANGKVWYYQGGTALLLSGNTLTNGSGQGLALLGNSNATATYLFVFRNALIDVVNVFGDAQLENPTWTSAWQTMNTAAGTSNSHHAIMGQDNIIYYCDDRYLGSIREVAGQVFNPATPSTYTFTQDALDLPQYEIANWLEELGINILIAGDSTAKIYPWDRLSDSFNNPIECPEKSIKRLKNIGNLVYILAGTWGNVYTTQGTYVRHFKKVSDYVTNNSGNLQSNPITWGGIDSMNGALLFGMSVLTAGNSGAYLLYPDGRLILDHIPSTGSDNVTAFHSQTAFYIMGYSNGADTMDTNRYANFESVVQSPLYKVATKTEKASYHELEVQMAKPASSGSIRVGYRTDTSSSFTTMTTFATDSTATSFKADIGIIDVENIQVQLEFHGTVEIIEIRLLP